MLHYIEEYRVDAELQYNAMIMSAIQIFMFNEGLVTLHQMGISCAQVVADMVCNVFGKLGYRFMKQWDGNYEEMIDHAIENGQYN